jgi:hypothetical protein
VTGESLGLLIEESRANLLSDTTDYSNWTLNTTTKQLNAGISPSGSNDAVKVIADAVTGGKYFYRSVSTTGNNVCSVYAKAGEYDNLRITELGTFTFYADFDLNAGTITNSGGANLISADIKDAGNGWYRCSISNSRTSVALCLTPFPDGSASGNASPPNYTGDGVSGIYIWGAQAELGNFPTSYIPTAGTTETRAADIASITGANFSSWYVSAPQTWFIDYDTPYVVANLHNPTLLNLNTIQYWDAPAVRVQAETQILYWDNSKSTFINSDFGVSTLSGRYALSLDVPSGSLTQAYNGAASPETFTATPFSNVTRMYLGDATGSSYKSLNGHISRLTYYPYRLADATLQEITS